jgi:hypothetical protein
LRKDNTGAAEVYSWGNGANYQLGTGTAGIQRIPCRIDALQSLDVIHIAAAKFHSAAVSANGDVYTWGFGRGGRLGHPDFDIHRLVCLGNYNLTGPKCSFLPRFLFLNPRLAEKALEMHRLLITCQLALTHAVVRLQSSPLDRSSVGLLERG